MINIVLRLRRCFKQLLLQFFTEKPSVFEGRKGIVSLKTNSYFLP